MLRWAAARCASENGNYTSEYGQYPPAFRVGFKPTLHAATAMVAVASRPDKQLADDRTNRLLSSVPPHRCWLIEFRSETIHGASPATASMPPTMRPFGPAAKAGKIRSPSFTQCLGTFVWTYRSRKQPQAGRSTPTPPVVRESFLQQGKSTKGPLKGCCPWEAHFMGSYQRYTPNRYRLISLSTIIIAVEDIESPSMTISKRTSSA